MMASPLFLVFKKEKARSVERAFEWKPDTR